MSDIKILIEREILDFIKFMTSKEYCLRNEKEHSEITEELLQDYIDEYLEGI